MHRFVNRKEEYEVLSKQEPSVEVHCEKCGSHLMVPLMWERFATTEAEMENLDWAMDYHLPCPYCRMRRGGAYPLMLVNPRVVPLLDPWAEDEQDETAVP